ncbi:DUF7144 family membrane protein [Arthrobacter sp. 49Tsu3.1M3]|uniref:DUF7144 family membrane protein n=1 Tax=Arthrobacter sp. 49Tsu3.1M3 TaxID=1279029 RepID=UPI0015C4743F|nr:hypothetical protein [Arthrobacter sp. 49Tsu3.1M3]
MPSAVLAAGPAAQGDRRGGQAQVLGVEVLVLTAVAFFSVATWARAVGVVLAGLSAVVQLILIPAQPWWSAIVIAIDELIVYAIVAHGSELRTAETPPNVRS